MELDWLLKRRGRFPSRAGLSHRLRLDESANWQKPGRFSPVGGVERSGVSLESKAARGASEGPRSELLAFSRAKGLTGAPD